MLRFAATTVILLISTAFGQVPRSVPASADFSSYRPLGEIRGWTFVAKDSALGQLISTVERETEIDGIAGYEISQILQLDYNKIGMERRQRIRSRHSVSQRGHYLGDKMVIDINEETEELELERNGNKLEGFFTRGASTFDKELDFPENSFATDILFLDLYENFLAMREIKIGDTIFDSVFVPQTMLFERVEAIVEHFGLISLYNQVKDSVFVIRFVQPQVMIFYFTAKKRLVKAEYLAQQMKAYLDIVRQIPPQMLVQPTFSLERFVKLLPHFGVFLLIGTVCLLFFAGADTFRHNLFLFVLIGGVSFIIVAFIQVPLQSYLTQKVFLPKVSEGQSPLLWAAVPALPAGVVQEMIKLGIIFLIFKFFKLGKRNPLLIGGAIGAGFGIAEASYILSHLPDTPLWSVNLVERGFIILFQAVSGVMLAAALLFNSKMKQIVIIAIVVLANSLFRYMPVFVQREMLDAELLYILIPIIPIMLLLYGVTLVKKSRNAFRN